MQSTLTHLECPECGRNYDFRRRQTVCMNCNSPLLARYDLERARGSLDLTEAGRRGGGIWRWAEVLPAVVEKNRLTLGEGNTPLVPAPRAGASIGMKSVLIKDEAANPTGSFKARGLAAAVSMAIELGIHELVIPTAGNAGGALAAYAARARVAAHVYMPADAPMANQQEVLAYGASLVLVDGLISDAGKQAAQQAAANGWLDVSTFKEPYRLEGKKTMGLELAEHFHGELPDVIIYPTGGGTGLVGMWKAFEEMEAMGWIGSARPRMVSVQAEGCAPVVRAIENGHERIEAWKGGKTRAAGLRVPSPFADRLILRSIRNSHGTALAVSEQEIDAAQSELGALEGLFAAPEGAAAWAALRLLRSQGWLDPDTRVVIFNTGSGLKYL